MNELAILDAIQTIHTPWLDTLLSLYTVTCDFGQIWILLGLVLVCIPKTRALGITVLVALIIGTLITDVLVKPLLMRPRPCDINPEVAMLIPRPHGSSFPSGHTTASFAAFGALLFAKGPRPLVIGVGIAAAIMAFSRLYCYVHYPTDVLAGMAVGLLAGFVASKIVEAVARRRAGDRSAGAKTEG